MTEQFTTDELQTLRGFIVAGAKSAGAGHDEIIVAGALLIKLRAVEAGLAASTKKRPPRGNGGAPLPAAPGSQRRATTHNRT